MRPHCGQTTCRPLVPWVRAHVQTVPAWLRALPSPALFLPSWLGVQGLGDLSQMELRQGVEASVSATSWRGRLGSPSPVLPMASGRACVQWPGGKAVLCSVPKKKEVERSGDGIATT